ncbi:outer membrane beta-barrel protein [Hymenobacter crusticola]|nr:outer membrane beta-barrel protein [Hymenobacter crusticola]
MRLFLVASVLVLHASFSSAQQTPIPRFYGGVQAFVSSFPIFYPGATNSYLTYSGPVELLAGYRFAPRWAMQVGWIGTRKVYHDGNHYVDPTTGGDVVNMSREDRRNTAIPVLMRYSLTRKMAHRVQFDVLAGVTLVHASYERRATRLVDEQLVFDDRKVNKATNIALCIGPSIRYSLGSHLGLIAHYGHNGTLNPRHKAGSPILATGFANTFTGGIHYRFGYK